MRWPSKAQLRIHLSPLPDSELSVSTAGHSGNTQTHTDTDTYGVPLSQTQKDTNRFALTTTFVHPNWRVSLVAVLCSHGATTPSNREKQF